jgi:hypothetical protein
MVKRSLICVLKQGVCTVEFHDSDRLMGIVQKVRLLASIRIPDTFQPCAALMAKKGTLISEVLKRRIS